MKVYGSSDNSYCGSTILSTRISIPTSLTTPSSSFSSSFSQVSRFPPRDMSIYERPSTSGGYYRRAISAPSFSSNYRIHNPSILEDEQVQSRSCTPNKPIYKNLPKETTPTAKVEPKLKGGAENYSRAALKKENVEIQISPSKYLNQEPRTSTKAQLFHNNSLENRSQIFHENTTNPLPVPQNEQAKPGTIHEMYKKMYESKIDQSKIVQFLPNSMHQEKVAQENKSYQKDYQQQKLRTMELFERVKSQSKFCPTISTFGKDPKRYLSANLSTDHYSNRPSEHDNAIYSPKTSPAPIEKATIPLLTGLKRRYTPREIKIARNIFKTIRETKKEDGNKHCGYGKPRIERPFMLGN